MEVLLGGPVEEGLSGRKTCGEGARRSASLPRLGGADNPNVEERSEEGIRLSMRRMSWTLVDIISLASRVNFN
jgi:hypothetical protein